MLVGTRSADVVKRDAQGRDVTQIEILLFRFGQQGGRFSAYTGGFRDQQEWCTPARSIHFIRFQKPTHLPVISDPSLNRDPRRLLILLSVVPSLRVLVNFDQVLV